jgi:hypothetical protein
LTFLIRPYSYIYVDVCSMYVFFLIRPCMYRSIYISVSMYVYIFMHALLCRSPIDTRAKLREIHVRRYRLRHSALELFLRDHTNYYLHFPSNDRDKVSHQPSCSAANTHARTRTHTRSHRSQRAGPQAHSVDEAAEPSRAHERAAGGRAAPVPAHGGLAARRDEQLRLSHAAQHNRRPHLQRTQPVRPWHG